MLLLLPPPPPPGAPVVEAPKLKPALVFVATALLVNVEVPPKLNLGAPLDEATVEGAPEADAEDTEDDDSGAPNPKLGLAPALLVKPVLELLLLLLLQLSLVLVLVVVGVAVGAPPKLNLGAPPEAAPPPTPTPTLSPKVFLATAGPPKGDALSDPCACACACCPFFSA
jgi:hypothetical protein